MTPREMVSELLSLIGDPVGKTIPPNLALRYLNDANNRVADLLFPFMPSRFRSVATDSGDGSTTEYTLPTDCAILERVTLRATTTSDEIDAMMLDIGQFNAVLHNALYSPSIAAGAAFYTERGNSQISLRPAPASNANALYFYYRKKPTSMRYDFGTGVYLTTALEAATYIQDNSKDWSANEWGINTSYCLVTKNHTTPAGTMDYDTPDVVVSSTQKNIITGNFITNALDQDLVDYEVYTPTDIPEKYHPLIVRQAQIVAERDPNIVTKLQEDFDRLFAVLVGGRA